MTKRKLSAEEIKAMMQPADFQREVMTEPFPESEIPPVWEKAMNDSLKKHKGEKLGDELVTDKHEAVIEGLDPEIGIQGPADVRVFETPLVKVSSNFSGPTYTLNVEPRHPKRPWKFEPNVIAMAIAKCLDEVIPRTVDVQVRPPMEDWEIMLFTFTAKDLKDHWNAPLHRLPEVEKKISEVMSEYC